MKNERNWIPVSIPKALHDKAQEEYKEKGFPNVSQMVAQAIRDFLKKKED